MSFLVLYLLPYEYRNSSVYTKVFSYHFHSFLDITSTVMFHSFYTISSMMFAFILHHI